MINNLPFFGALRVLCEKSALGGRQVSRVGGWFVLGLSILRSDSGGIGLQVDAFIGDEFILRQ